MLFETHLREHVFPAFDGAVAISELTRELGCANAAVNDAEDVAEDAGIAAAAAAHDVPVFAPAIQDSVLGIQAWMHSQVSAFTLDALADLTNITDVAFDAERPPVEARSWGKLEKSAKNVTVLGDATITLPLLVAAARDRIEG